MLETKELGFEIICDIYPLLEPKPYEGNFQKHGEHDQSDHGSWATGEAIDGLQTQAKQFKSLEEFSNAISQQGLRPRMWHIAEDEFKLDPNRKPTNRLGGTSDEAGLFVGDPETWQDYAIDRKTVIEYDMTGLTWTKNPLSDTKADFFTDQSGNQGFFVRPQGFGKLKEIGRFSIEEAKSRAIKQQNEMPKSKEEARKIWESLNKVQKHGDHDQSEHGNWATGTTPNTIESSTNDKGITTYDVTYGDINLKIDGEQGIDDARHVWTFRDGNDAARLIASRLMDIDNPSAKPRLDLLTARQINEGVIGVENTRQNADDYARAKGEIERKIASAVILTDRVHKSEPSEVELYRGIKVKNDLPIVNIKEGDSFTLPVSSTTTGKELAEFYAKPQDSDNETPIVFTFRAGTKSESIREARDETGKLLNERVTQGKFKVASVDKSNLIMDGNRRKSGYIQVTVEHTDTFNVREKKYEPVKP